MDIFTRQKQLIRSVVVLGILNLSLIIYLVFFNPKATGIGKKKDHREVSDILQKELNLTPDQEEKIRALRTRFFENERALSQSIRAERDSMNAEMFQKDTEDSLVLSLAERISRNEYQMEMLRYDQSRELKAICTPDQLEKFGKLVREIRDYFKPEKGPSEK